MNALIVHARETQMVRHALLFHLISICVAHPFRLLICIAAIWPGDARSDLFFSDEQIAAVVNEVQSGRCEVMCSLGESRLSKFNAERISGPHGDQQWLVYLIKEGWCGSAGCGSTLIAFFDTEVRVIENAFGLAPGAVQMPDFSSPKSIAVLQSISISPFRPSDSIGGFTGPWRYKKQPDFKLNPGEKKGSIYVAEDGAVFVDGAQLFPAAIETYVSVSMQENSSLALVIQNDVDYGGIQAALINTAGGDVLFQNLIREPSGLRKYIKYDSAWSPDGRYVGLVSGPNEVPDVAIIDLDAGTVEYIQPDFVRSGKGRGVLLNSMATLDDGQIAVDFVEKYCDKDCRGPETAFHNIVPAAASESESAILEEINRLRIFLPKSPSYLFDTSTTSKAIATVWIKSTALVRGVVDIQQRYDEAYLAAIEYLSLADVELSYAQRLLMKGDRAAAKRHISNHKHLVKMYQLSSDTALKIYLDDIESASILARGFYDGSKEAIDYGINFAGLGPVGSLLVDIAMLSVDFSVDFSDAGMDEATKNLVKNVIIKVLMEEIEISEGTTEYIGRSDLYDRLSKISGSPEVKKQLMSFISKSTAHGVEKLGETSVDLIAEKLSEYFSGTIAITSETSPSLYSNDDASMELRDSERSLVRDLLEAYKNDVERINEVAGHADYAALAWASYEGGDALQLAKTRGWTPFKSFADENLIVGDTSATLFVSDEGTHVLAFRGTKTLGDWVTNLKGTLSAKEISNQQIEGARKIAREVAEQHPEVVFVGHSLGGRMAQVARLETGKAAVTFNTAPLGINDRVKALGTRKEPKAALVSFKSPEDPLSSLFSPNDIEIANIEPVKGGGLTDAVNADYTHSMAVIARAMEDVRYARDEGWIAVYLSADNISQPQSGLDFSKTSVPAGGYVVDNEAEVFEKLKSLVNYLRKPEDKGRYASEFQYKGSKLYLVREDIRLERCSLVSEKSWWATSSIDAIDFNTPVDQQTILSFAWNINLYSVNAEKTNALRESKIIMVRGEIFTYLIVKQKGWRKSEDLQVISSFGDDTSGGYSYSPDYKDKLLEDGDKRSGHFELGLAYPEKQKEIQDTFNKLVKSCKLSPVMNPFGLSIAKIKEKPGVSIEEKIIGKWGSPGGNLKTYYEFYPDHTFVDRTYIMSPFLPAFQTSFEFDPDKMIETFGTWAVENDAIKLTNKALDTTVRFQNSDLVPQYGKGAGPWLVRLETISNILISPSSVQVPDGIKSARQNTLASQLFISVEDCDYPFETKANNHLISTALGKDAEQCVSFPYLSRYSNPEPIMPLYHAGVDIKANFQEAYAIVNGTIITNCGRNQVLNNNSCTDNLGIVMIETEINNTKARVIYAHLSESFVTIGMEVKVGDLIGITGNRFNGNPNGAGTPHLHIEVRPNYSRTSAVGFTSCFPSPCDTKAKVEAMTMDPMLLTQHLSSKDLAASAIGSLENKNQNFANEFASSVNGTTNQSTTLSEF